MVRDKDIAKLSEVKALPRLEANAFYLRHDRLVGEMGRVELEESAA